MGLACYFGHVDAVEYLIKAGAPVNSSSRNSLKAAPIQSAVAAGHERVVQILLQFGADPNVREQNDYAPLHTAAQNRDAEMVRTLLYGGADLTFQGDDGKTALDIAMDAGDEKVISILKEGITKRFKLKRE